MEKKKIAAGAPQIGEKARLSWLSALPLCLALTGLIWFFVSLPWPQTKIVFLTPLIVWSCSLIIGLGNILACTILHFPSKRRKLIYAGVVCSAVFLVSRLLIPAWNRFGTWLENL